MLGLYFTWILHLLLKVSEVLFIISQRSEAVSKYQGNSNHVYGCTCRSSTRFHTWARDFQYITTIFEKFSLNNFADDNTLEAHTSSVKELVNSLEKDSQNAIDWFKINYMIANPDKFKAIIINKTGKRYLWYWIEHQWRQNIHTKRSRVVRNLNLFSIILDTTYLKYAKWLQIN